VIVAIINDFNKVTQTALPIKFQLSANVAPETGINDFTKIIINGMITNNNVNKINGSNKTNRLCARFVDRDEKNLDLKFIWVSFNSIQHNVNRIFISP
jgi:hypothetical protein